MPVFSIRRATIAKSCLTAAILLTTAAGCAGNGIQMRQITRGDFWGALAELRPDAAARYSRTFSQRLFAQSLGFMMEGDVQRAEIGFASLREIADDTLLRAGARVAYSAALQYEEKWRELSIVPPLVNPGRDADRAGVERWAAAFASASPKAYDFPSHPVIVPLTLSVVTTPMIPVRINGKNYHFWLDTGSSLTIIASGVAARLGITPVSQELLEMVTATGRVSARPALIGKVELGQIAVSNVTAMIVDDRMMQMRPTKRSSDAPVTGPVKIDGIIGFDILHRIDVEIDYGESMVRLRDPALRPSGDPSSRNLFWLGVPVVRLLATDGTPLYFGLDTGAQETFGTETMFEKLETKPDRKEGRSVGGLAGIASLQAPVLHELNVSVRGHPLFLRELVIYAPAYRTLVSLDGVLGADVSLAGVVRIDATNGIFSVDEGVRKPTLVN